MSLPRYQSAVSSACSIILQMVQALIHQVNTRIRHTHSVVVGLNTASWESRLESAGPWAEFGGGVDGPMEKVLSPILSHSLSTSGA